MVRNIILSFAMALATLSANAAPEDSIRVVKGQVSDYYITVTKERIVKGHVVDNKQQPLEGATVMFFASPMHCTTAHDGSFAIKGAENDRHFTSTIPARKS